MSGAGGRGVTREYLRATISKSGVWTENLHFIITNVASQIILVVCTVYMY